METARVQSPPAKPLLIFDGDCHFCLFWIRRWQRATGDRVDYLPYQSPTMAGQFPELTPERFEKSVQFIEPNGTVYQGAEAVFRSLATNPRRQHLQWMYQKIPGFAPLTEWCYRFVANHRTLFSALTRLWFPRE